MAKKPEEEEKDLGYIIMGDLLLQLVTFFILMYVFASANTSKTQGGDQQVIDAIRQSFQKQAKSHKKQDKAVQQKDTEQVKNPGTIEAVIDTVKVYIQDSSLESYISTVVSDDKIRILLQQPILFDSGYAELKPKGKEILSDLVTILSQIPNPMIIEGHTDSMPIHNEQYDSNWDLSFDRAYNVLKYLVKEHSFSPARISAVGYGEYTPIVPNDSEDNRAKNRRIEITMKIKEVYMKKKNVAK